MLQPHGGADLPLPLFSPECTFVAELICAPNMDTHGQFVAAIERLATVVRTIQWSLAAAEGLHPIQYRVLQLCGTRRGQGLMPSVLAAELGVSAASMSDTLRALESKGLLKRLPHPHDRRGTILELTAKGERLRKRLQQWDSPLQAAIAELPTEIQENVYEGLLMLLRVLYKQGVITLPRMCLTCRWLTKNTSNGQPYYYCQLLTMPLEILQLRVECPEHEAAEDPTTAQS